MAFQNLVVKIFKSHGFEIDSTSNYNKYILATKDNIILSVGYNEPGSDLTMGDLRNFYRSAKRDNADRMIYVMPGAIPQSIERFADERNIQLWDRERLEREIGRAVVTDMETLDKLIELDSDFDNILKSAPKLRTHAKSEVRTKKEPVTDETAILVPTMFFNDEPLTTSTSTTVKTKPSYEEYTPEKSIYESSQVPNLDDHKNNYDLNIIKPRVTKDLAATMANKIVKGFRFNLELIPYYVFNYSCTLNAEDKEYSKIEGVLGINGLTSNVEDWEDNIETVHVINEPHTLLDTKFNYDNALSLVKKAVMERNTKIVETREEYDSTIIFEKKKLKPKPEAIDINSKGIYYLPVWCVEGNNGLMIIDANSGKVIKEDIFKAS